MILLKIIENKVDYLLKKERISFKSTRAENKVQLVEFLKIAFDSILKDYVYEFTRKNTFYEILTTFGEKRKDLFAAGLGTHYGYFYKNDV